MTDMITVTFLDESKGNRNLSTNIPRGDAHTVESMVRSALKMLNYKPTDIPSFLNSGITEVSVDGKRRALNFPLPDGARTITVTTKREWWVVG